MIYALCYEEIRDCNQKKETDKESAGLVIEQQADKKQIGIAQQCLALQQGKQREDYREESPELKMCEQQRTIGVESKNTLDVFE